MGPRILLINPWITDFAAYDFWLKPLGLLYIAAVLRKNGYEVQLLDCMNRYDAELLASQRLQAPKNRLFSTGKFHREIIPKPPLYQNIPRNYGRYGLPLELVRARLARMPAPDVLLVTSGMTYWYPGVQMMIRELRHFFPNTPVVLGGIYATLCQAHAVGTSGADYVISGEGELPALKLVDDLTGNRRDYGSLYGHLDALPAPAFDLYAKNGSAAIMTSRGCPLKCTFCASGLVAGAYRWRSPEHVIEEIAWLHRELQISEFAFYDDALLTNHKRHLNAILQRILAADWRLSFHTPNGLQCKLLDAGIARQMLRAGFKTIRLSYESGNPERQKDMSKKVSNETFARAVQHLFRAGFRHGDLDAYVMMALPGQSVAEVLWSMAFVHAHGVKIRLAAFSPIPGTVEWQRAVNSGLISADSDPLLSNNSIVPVRPPGASYRTFENISLLAKQLNAGLGRGDIREDFEALARDLCRHFEKSELSEIEPVTA